MVNDKFNVKQEKANIRKQIIKLRENMPKEDVCSKSRSIFNKLLELSQFQQAKLIMCYMDFRNEVMTSEIIEYCTKNGKRIALPHVSITSDGAGMSAYGMETGKCVPGMYGILEPDSTVTCEVDKEEIDLVIVPGVAFGMNKYRIGFGAGYYDGFLIQLKPECVKIGLAYEIQIVDIVPNEAHDIAMDIMITESRII